MTRAGVGSGTSGGPPSPAGSSPLYRGKPAPSRKRQKEKASMTKLPTSWQALLADELEQPYFHQLQEFLREERRRHLVCPPEKVVFNALKLTPYAAVKVLLLG